MVRHDGAASENLEDANLPKDQPLPWDAEFGPQASAVQESEKDAEDIL